MSVNSSSSSSLPSNSSYINLYDFLQKCYNTTAGTFSIIAFTVTTILLVLPLCIYVIYLGFQRWRQQRSGWTTSHSDIFTYNMVVLELMTIVGAFVRCCGVLTRFLEVMTLGTCLISISITGQLLFHSLTCVERYLAVVHPVIYLGLKKAKGIRIRNISIGCVWLLCFANMGLLFMQDNNFINIFASCFLFFNLIVISFCSLSVLYVLIRPGPGAGGEARQRVDQSKMRAFYTIMAILGVLLLRVVGTAVNSIVYTSPHVRESEKCGMLFSVLWLTLPNSLVLPLLFLLRTGKLLCCKNINQSGQGSD